MKGRVLVAGFATRHVAQSAHRAGYEVCAVDHFCDQDLSWYTKDREKFEDLADLPGAIERICRRHRFDFFVPTSGAETLPPPAPLLGTPAESIGRFLDKLDTQSAKLLKDYDIELIEAHHRNKKDAPSGTAKTLLQIIEEEAGGREKMYGREGMTERKNEIGVHVIRGGDIVGDHKVMYSKNYETIELSHRAYDRSVFASGALVAARWVVGKKPGVYGMNDVLGLKKK